MEDGALALLGLGQRAGSMVVGVSGVRAALKRGELSLVVVAADHSRRTDEKVVRLARGKGIRIVIGPRATELGRRLGREEIQAVGVRDPELAGGIDAVRDPDGG